MAEVDDLLRPIADKEAHERRAEEDEPRAGKHGKRHGHVAALAHNIAMPNDIIGIIAMDSIFWAAA